MAERLGRLRAWTVHLGEAVPVDDPFRPYRYTHLARALLDRGCEVVQFAPTFYHSTKTSRGPERVIALGDRHELRLLEAGRYSRHRSLARLRFHARAAARFRWHARQIERPDLLICPIPTPSLLRAAVAIRRETDCRLVVDVRDLWPDVFVASVPSLLAPLARAAVLPVKRAVENGLRQADAVVAVSESYLTWADELSRGLPVPKAVFGLGANVPDAPPVSGPRSGVVFAGGFNAQVELRLVVEAVSGLPPETRTVLAGDGPDRSAVAAVVSKIRGPEVISLPGWVSPAELTAIYEQSAVGVLPYRSKSTVETPNKLIEYLAYGLVVVSSIRGPLIRELEASGLAVTYPPGDAAGLREAIHKALRLARDDLRPERAWRVARREGDARLVYAKMSDFLLGNVLRH